MVANTGSRGAESGVSRGVAAAWLLPTCLLLAIVLPLALLGAVTWVLPRPESQLSAAAHPVGYPVQTGPDAGTAGAVATLTWNQGLSLRAPAWSGLVLSVEAEAGQTLTTGTPVAVVDGVTRVAMASPTPFYRPLSRGDRGPDVAMLRTAIAAVVPGDYGTGDAFDVRLQAGVGALCERLGCGARTAVFDPGWFVYLPADTVTVGEVHLSPASPAPLAGEEIITAAAVLSGLTVGPGSGTDALASSRFPTSGEGYEFVARSTAVALAADFTGTGSLEDLARAVGQGTASVTGSVRLIQPRQASSVAAAALVTGATGRVCVYPYGVDPSQLTPVPVTVVGGEPGITKVEPLRLDQVLANPADLSGLPPCS